MRSSHTTVLYKMEAEEMAIEFFSLFSGKTLKILHMLPAEHGSYEHIKAALQKAFGRSADDARKAFATTMINAHETAVQDHALLTRE